MVPTVKCEGRRYGVPDLSTVVAIALVHQGALFITPIHQEYLPWQEGTAQGTVVQTDLNLSNHIQAFRLIHRLQTLAQHGTPPTTTVLSITTVQITSWN